MTQIPNFFVRVESPKLFSLLSLSCKHKVPSFTSYFNFSRFGLVYFYYTFWELCICPSAASMYRRIFPPCPFFPAPFTLSVLSCSSHHIIHSIFILTPKFHPKELCSLFGSAAALLLLVFLNLTMEKGYNSNWKIE
jgi:hypothetical protein